MRNIFEIFANFLELRFENGIITAKMFENR